jgi:hypothetical protein
VSYRPILPRPLRTLSSLSEERKNKEENKEENEEEN